MSHKSAVILGIAAALLAFHTDAAARPIAITDMRTIVDLEEPAISPDGSRVAVVTIREDHNALVVVGVASRAQLQIASGGSVAVPRWSPDGSQIAFLKQDAEGKLQLFAWSSRAGTRQVARFPGGVVDFAWSPNGKQIAVGANDAPPAQPFFYAGDNDYTLASWVPAEHLWMVAASGGKPRRLASGDWTVAPTDAGGIFASQFAWTQDGNALIFARIPTTASGDNEFSTLWRYDLRTNGMRKLTAHDAFELSPAVSPGGDRWLYSYPRGGNYLAENSIRIVENGSERDLTAGFDLNASGALWMPDGRSLLVCADDHTRVGTWLFDLHGAFRRLPLDGLNMSCDSYQDAEYDSGLGASVSAHGAVAFVGSDSRRARELYYLSSVAAQPVQLTHLNDFVARLGLGTQREISWRSTGGFTEYGVVTLPPHAVAGRKYPIVVDIHGGPGEASLQDLVFSPTWPRTQLIASHGYIVFEPNYRGSDDAGNAFLLAIVGDSVRGPAADIMSGLHAVEQLPQADASRVGVCGWSYGGQLTSWLITQFHDWRAAVSGASVTNETEEYAFSQSNVQDRYYQGTSPYAPGGDRIYRDNSPITFADAVDTPTLLWSTNDDPVVPVTQSYEFYHALHEHHVPVRLAIFPGSTHGPATERQTESLMEIWLGWFDRYLR